MFVAVDRWCVEAFEPFNFRMTRLEHAYPVCSDFCLCTAGHKDGLTFKKIRELIPMLRRVLLGWEDVKAGGVLVEN